MKNFLNNAKKVAPKNPSIASLMYCMMDKETITVSNLEVQYKFKHGLQVQGSGLVPFHKFAEAYNKLKDIDNIVITIDTALINKGKTTLRLATLQDDEIPCLVVDKQTSSGQIEFCDKFIKAQKFVSKDELRPVMTGVFFNNHSIVSTDVYKLYFTKHNSNISEEFILPKDSFFLRGSFNFVKSGTHIKFTNENEEVTVRLINGKYPNYDAVIPKDNPNKFSINKKELVSALDTLSIAYNKTTKLIVVSHNKLYAEDLDMNTSCDVSVDMFNIKEGVIKFGINAGYLTDIISSIDSDVITFENSTPNRAMIINGEYLLMPVHL
jgi:DNA polymerase III sliding clamp (beta) subunit (PCNA family)